MSPRMFLCAFACTLLLAVQTSDAAPADAKVGDVRAVFAKDGTVIRKTASTLGAPVSTLAFGTQVRVLELKKPWMRVQALDKEGAQGWLRSWKTTELSALGANAKPAHLKVTGSAGADAREVSAAGRQLDADTERGFRATRKDLEKAYAAVDAMEAATQTLHPGDALAFIDQGNLGRRGRDYARPGRVKPSQRRANRSRSRGGSRGAGGLLGRLGGEAARRLGAGDTASRAAEALVSAATDYVDQVKVAFTPEQEYFLGRAVAAQAIARYGVDPDAKRRRYVRLVGEAVVRLTSRLPANVGGYHFEVLDSDEINGVSGPGGFVLLTRGAVEACQSETELAGILAHELAHIRAKDGERVIRKSKEFPSFVKGLAGAAGAAAGAGSFGRGLVRFFGQVASRAGTTAIDHGYGRALEFAADKEGTYLLFDVYYEPTGLQSFLARMKGAHGHHGASATHGSPAQRAQALTPVLAELPFKAPAKMLAPRKERFAATLGR